MPTEPTGDGQNAEIVQLHPDALPAVPAEPGQELEPAGQQAPARVVYQDITRVAGERLPVIPPQWSGRANIRASLLLVGGQHWHRARYHGVRSPLYLLSAIWWAIVGVFRVVARQVHWWWLLEQHDLRSLAVVEGDSREWTKLHKEAKETRKVRGLILAAEIVGVAVAILILIHLHIWWAWLILIAVIVPLLARYGRPEDLRIIRTAIIPPDYSPPTHEIITGALGSLGIPNINAALRVDKDGRSAGIRFISEVYQTGPGWGCMLDLPGGVTVSHILARREEFASGLRRPLSATWPSGVPQEHPGRLDLWIGFQDISKMRAPKWPLLKAASTDVFDRLPFGTDPRGRGVTVPLFEVNWLIGAAPGQGKTSAVRGLACGVALDVLADLWIHEQAGKGDLEPLAQVCHRYCSGLDDESIAYAAESLRLLRGELDRRSTSLKSVPKEDRPEGKVTRELAARKTLKLRPLVAIFDEIQNVFLHPVYGKQAAEDAAHVIRLGRAYGVILVLSTQRPTTECLPAAVSGNVTARFCLQVPGQVENDLILGTSSYKDGYKATAFRPKTDAGLGWLKADGLPQIVRTYKVDLPECEKIAARARVMRDRAGVLTGYALTEGEQLEARDVLADVLAVFGDAPGLHWAELADRLANRWPDRWADCTSESISAQCRSLGIQSTDVRMAGVTLKGCRRVGVDKARPR
jgi:S-DNA-T family DNA segregation ATPase FtsK/SpoIIIE